MAFSLAQKFVSLGMAPALAKEFSFQIESTVFNQRRLSELGMIPELSRYVVSTLPNGTFIARKAMELSMTEAIADLTAENAPLLYFFSSGALRWATTLQNVGGSDSWSIVRKYIGYFPQPTYGHRFMFPAFNAGGVAAEAPCTSPILIERYAVVSSPTQSATDGASVATFGQIQGADSYLIDPAINTIGVLTDDVGTKASPIAAGHIFLEYAYKVNSGLNYPRAFPLAPNQSVEGTSTSTTTSRASLVGVRTALSVGATAANVYTPSYSVCKNIGPSDIAFGDSKQYGENETAYSATLTNRGYAWGTYGRKWAAMDRTIFIASVPGSNPEKWVGNGGSVPGTADLPNFWAKKKAAIALCPNFPANRVFNQHGGNSTLWTNATAYHNGQAALKAFYQSEFGATLPVYACLVSSRLSSTDGYTTLVNQTPLTTYLPGGTIRTIQTEMVSDNMGGVFAGYVDGWVAFGSDSDPSRSPPNSETGQATTLASPYTSGTNTLVLTDASGFAIGDFVRLDPTGSGATAAAVNVLNKSGNTLTLNTGGFGYSVAAGVAVVGTFVADGTHESSQGHKRAASRLSVPS